MILVGFITIILSIFTIGGILNEIDIHLDSKEKVAYMFIIYIVGFMSGLIFNIMLI